MNPPAYALGSDKNKLFNCYYSAFMVVVGGEFISQGGSSPCALSGIKTGGKEMTNI
jgi:hypothetical protein